MSSAAVVIGALRVKRKQLMSRSWQATISPLLATLTNAFREAHDEQLQTSGKKGLCINPQEEAPHEPPQKRDRQGHQKARTDKIQNSPKE